MVLFFTFVGVLGVIFFAFFQRHLLRLQAAVAIANHGSI